MVRPRSVVGVVVGTGTPFASRGAWCAWSPEPIDPAPKREVNVHPVLAMACRPALLLLLAHIANAPCARIYHPDVSAWLLYDADCAFCSRVAGYAARVRLRVTVAPIQVTDLGALGVSPTRAMRELPFVGTDGAVVYGHAAVAAALATGAAPLRLLARAIAFGPLDRVSARLYRWVAAHRHQLPGGSAACAVPTRGN